jgi:hypothetical protein
MNSRRFMGCPPQTGGRRLPHRYVKTLLCITAKLIVEWQRWVNRAVFRDVRVTSAYAPRSATKRTWKLRVRANSRLILQQNETWHAAISSVHASSAGGIKAEQAGAG